MANKPPAGILPIYLRSAMVEQYGLIDETTKEPVVFKKIPKQTIIDDIVRQGVYNDFSEMRAKIQAIPLEELLFLHDPEGKYEGANFLICASEDIYQQRMQAAEAIEEQRRIEAEAKAEVERKRQEEEAKLLIYEEHDYTARPWQSLGSEEDIAKFALRKNRPPLCQRISRKRRDFGVVVEFVDQEAPEKAVDLRKQIVTNYDLKRSELDVGLQAMPLTVDAGTQSSWRRQVNKNLQYEAVSLSENSSQTILHSHTLSNFLLRALPLCSSALQQNETFNLFQNEFKIFENDDLTVGNKAENNVKDLHTLSDLQYSKQKEITCVDWIPGSTTSLGMSCSSKATFDQRVDQCGKAVKSHILVWTLRDLITPQLVLEAPSDIFCFRFNPNRPDIIIAGLINGQIALWDVTEVRAALREREASKTRNKTEGDSTAAVDDDSDKAAPNSKPIQPLLLTNIEKGHPRMVSDLEWLPRHNELSKRGEISKSELAYSQQFVSVSPGGNILFWDLRHSFHEKKTGSTFCLALGSEQAVAQAAASAAQAVALAALAAETSGGASSPDALSASKDEEEARNPKWTPFFQLPLIRPSDNRELSAVRMTIGDTSQFVVSTEDGELAMCDWGSGKKDDDDDGGKKKVVKNVYRCHYLNATALQKSPHFPDLYLTVGDWSFHIWKLGMDVPLFSSPFADENVLSGCWSPTRPAVIVIALADGTVHFWDLLDQSHRPTAVQSVSSNAISSLRFCPPAHSLQYLAAADSQGDLHILEIPRNLRRKLAGEEELMSHFYQREVDRVNYYRNLTPLPPPAQPGSKPKNEEKVEQNDTTAADDKAEQDYQKQLLKFQQELGLVKGGGGDD